MYFVVGPETRDVELPDESEQLNNEELLRPYYWRNAPNIFTNALKQRVDPLWNKGMTNYGLKAEDHDFLRSLTLTIKRLHVRYEDDFFSNDSPYSFGMVIEELSFATNDTSDTTKLVKDLSVRGLRVYWNCMSEMYVPRFPQ